MRNGRQSENVERVKRVREVEASSGNVFADLDLPDADALLAKAELARRIGEILSARKLTQAQAAAVRGGDQPKVSALIRARHDMLDTERGRTEVSMSSLSSQNSRCSSPGNSPSCRRRRISS